MVLVSQASCTRGRNARAVDQKCPRPFLLAGPNLCWAWFCLESHSCKQQLCCPCSGPGAQAVPAHAGAQHAVLNQGTRGGHRSARGRSSKGWWIRHGYLSPQLEGEEAVGVRCECRGYEPHAGLRLSELNARDWVQAPGSGCRG